MDLFAATPPGIAELTASELRGLGIEPVSILPDGVAFSGGMDTVRRANVELRTANRVLARMGTFTARTFAELERHAARLGWRDFIEPGRDAQFRVSARKCRLFHTGAIAERLAGAAGVTVAAAATAAHDAPTQLFVVRGVRDEWTVSADSSGEHLHRRGYRLETARAPMRETLAAAAVLASDWDRRAPLVDPFCGAGTICIEAALLAIGRAPGAGRAFAFARWPSCGEVAGGPLSPSHQRTSAAAATVLGYDRDAGAIEAATANAVRAGAEIVTEFARQALSSFEPPAARGWVVTNPPYGVRVGERGDLRDLYARFGAVLRERCTGWRVGFFSADPLLERATRLRLEPLFRTENGGLRVRFVQAEV